MELKSISVRSPTKRGETAQVGRAIAHLALWSAAVMIASRAARLAGPVRDDLALDEIAFRTLESADQRVFRLALEGIGEGEDVRARTGAWPTVETLAARGIPPFAADPIDHAGYHWKQLHDGPIINYVGVPSAGSKRPVFLIVVVEPDPGTANDPSAPTDETHKRLRDGTMLHVMVWMGTRDLDSPLAAPRLEDGWRRITAVAGGMRA